MMMEPVQLVSWWPTWRCLTPALHRHLWLPLALLVATIGINAYWVVNRADPLVILEQTVVPQGRPGDVLHFSAKVRRDYDPPCSVASQRVVISSTGYRFNIDSTELSGETLRMLTQATPDHLYSTLVIPQGVAPGRATLVTSLTYKCNPIDTLLPNTATTVLYFDVLPPS